MNIFCIGYRVVHHDDLNEMPFVIEWIANTTVIWIDNDMQDVLRRQNIVCSRECNVNEVRDPPRARIWRKIRESVSSVYRKPFLMRKLEPRHDNPPCASSSLFTLSKRFVLSIMKHSDICVIGFLLEIVQYNTLPYLFSLLLLFVGSEERSLSPCKLA